MTQILHPDLYDEDSVFNKVLAMKNEPRRPTAPERLEAIFAEAPVPEETINVMDFLPRY